MIAISSIILYLIIIVLRSLAVGGIAVVFAGILSVWMGWSYSGQAQETVFAVTAVTYFTVVEILIGFSQGDSSE